MVPASIEQLLILQDRDARCEHVKKQLVQIPGERTGVEREIAAEQSRVAALEAEIEQLRVRNAGLEGDVGEAQARIVKYKTQQMEVKKNDEYQALEQEITNLGSRIEELEDAQLALLESIDGKAAELEVLRAAVARQVVSLENRLKALSEAEAENQGQLGEAAAELEKARSRTDEAALKMYDFVKSQVKRPPYLCPIEQSKCTGCHLRVSADVESQARHPQEFPRCDSCGRLVYMER